MKRFLIIMVAVVLLLTACASAASPEMARSEDFAAPGIAMEMPAAPEAMADSAGRGNAVASSAEPASQERLVIKNANLSIVVADPEAKMSEIAALASSLGGHVVSSNIYQTYADNGVRVPEGNITIRVQAEQLNTALNKIKKDAVEVENETVSGEDVTDQYVDLQSRLRAKETAEKKLIEIMDNAQDTEDVLSVYGQLQVIQSDIEVLTGQINYYERSAALSSISVQVIAEEKSKPIEIGGWELGETASESVQDLIDYMQGFVQFMIRFIILILPVLISIFLPFYLVFIGIRALARKNRKKKAAQAPETPPAEK